MSNDASKQLLAAALDLGEARPDRAVPSPSSVNKCTRQNWFKARGEPKTDQPDNGESVIAQETGRVSESFLLQMACVAYNAYPIYQQEDDDTRELRPAELARVSMAGGQVDNVLRMPDGEEVLFEAKRKGVWDVIDLTRRGVREAEENDYVQLQSLMHAKELPRALYVCANWDRGMLTSHTVGWSKPKSDPWAGERPDGVVAEWVEYNEAEALAAKARAEKQQRFIDNEDDPSKVPTDYHGEMLDPNAGKFPCTWCPWWKRCKGVG